MKTFILICLLTICFFSVGYSADQIYVWEDENGKTQYSEDRPEGLKDQEYTLIDSKVISDPDRGKRKVDSEPQIPQPTIRPDSGQRDQLIRKRNRQAKERMR